ncbi:MAG: 3-phosphoserine/phosphohydroxythreonine transaminase [Neisseriaceae bacterium]
MRTKRSNKEVFNFSAGPAVMPIEVLQAIQTELLDYKGTGLSLMTVSHRSAIFLEVLKELENNLAELLKIPQDKYAVLCLQGGASLQFIDICLNLSLSRQRRVGYVISGNWSRLAYQQMRKTNLILTEVIASSEKEGQFTDIPEQKDWKIEAPLDFIHFASNETVHGIQFPVLPKRLDPSYPALVVDMSSDLLAREIEVCQYGLIYASAQKNLGPPGVTLVVVKKDWLDYVVDVVPDVLAYRAYWKKDGMYNTPNTFGIYACMLVTRWLLKNGGIPWIREINTQKAELLYKTIDESEGFYINSLQRRARSQMNVVFRTPSQALDELFIQKATEANLHFLRGYRSVGGMRASIYNAMPLRGVEALCQFMVEFQKSRSKTVYYT